MTELVQELDIKAFTPKYENNVSCEIEHGVFENGSLKAGQKINYCAFRKPQTFITTGSFKLKQLTMTK